MARTKGSIGWKKQQAYLHEKFPEQGWMEEEDREKIKDNYKGVKASEEEAKEAALDMECYRQLTAAGV